MFRLARVPRLPIKAENLPLLNSSELYASLMKEDLSGAWEQDHAVVTRVFNNPEAHEGVNLGDRRAIYALVSLFKPKRVLEIGTHVGASTLYFALALKRLANNGKLTTVDLVDVNSDTGPWKKAGLSHSPSGYLEHLALRDICTFVTASSVDFLATHQEQYDFIFLDGSHLADFVYREAAACSHLLAPNGILLLHDFHPKGKPLYPDGVAIAGPWLAFQRIKKELPEMQVLPLGELPWDTKQGVRLTSLAVATR